MAIDRLILPGEENDKVLRGHSGNAIASDVLCATIAGGGTSGRENVIGGTDVTTVSTGNPNVAGTGSGANYCVITGGYDNMACGEATVLSGYHNYTKPGATHGTIAGGSIQKIDAGNYNTIGGGTTNTINTSGGNGSVIAGGTTNSVTGTTATGTISGGEGNAVSASRGTIGGGRNNTVSAASGTIGGGEGNTASTGTHATVGGGTTNTASATTATIAGGDRNEATAANTSVGGGSLNDATAAGATVAGGVSNAATAINAAIAGGTGNTASGSGSAVVGGASNTASGSRATVLGGDSVTASGDYSSASGFRSIASLFGERACAAGYFAAQGDAQERRFIMRRSTTDATPTEVRLDGSSAQLTIPDDTTWFFRVRIAARRADANDESAAYLLDGCIDRNSGAATTAIVGSVTKTVVAEDTAGWDVAATADTSAGALSIKVTGEAAKTIRWVALVEVVQVTG